MAGQIFMPLPKVTVNLGSFDIIYKHIIRVSGGMVPWPGIPIVLWEKKIGSVSGSVDLHGQLFGDVYAVCCCNDDGEWWGEIAAFDGAAAVDGDLSATTKIGPFSKTSTTALPRSIKPISFVVKNQCGDNQ